MDYQYLDGCTKNVVDNVLSLIANEALKFTRSLAHLRNLSLTALSWQSSWSWLAIPGSPALRGIFVYFFEAGRTDRLAKWRAAAVCG